jgi:hypothetical protein
MFAIQTLQRAGRRQRGRRVPSAVGWGKCFEETEEGDDLGGLFLRGKKIGVQPQST